MSWLISLVPLFIVLGFSVVLYALDRGVDKLLAKWDSRKEQPVANSRIKHVMATEQANYKKIA